MNARAELLGVFPNMPAADYFAAEGVNNSLLKDMAKSPAHAFALHFAPDRPEREQTVSMFSGTLVHCAQLEPDAMAARYIVVPEDAPRRPTKAQWSAKKPSLESVAAMDWWAEFNQRAEGLQIVTAEQYDTVRAQLAAINAVPELAELFASGVSEQSFFWRDAATGLICKGRSDFVHTLADGRAIMIDLKSAVDVSPAGFSRAVANMGYYRQDAWYSSGWEEATGQELAGFVFAAVSNTYPFIAVPYMLDDETKAQGAEENAELLSAFAECRRTNTWPAYGEGMQLIGLPKWAQRDREVEVAYV